MQRLVTLLLSLLFLCGFGVTAAAEETTVFTEVPAYHTVTLEADGGKVVADNRVCGAAVQIERQKEQTYWIIPDADQMLSTLYYNGEDVTAQVRLGVFTAPSLVNDATLEAVFSEAPAAPDDKTYDTSGTIGDEDGNPLSGVTVTIGDKTDVTDENGHFEIEALPSGTHTITAVDEEGNIIGHGEITIDKAEDAELALVTDEDGRPVVKPGRDTESIGLTFAVGEDGLIAVTDAADTTPEPERPGPQSDAQSDTQSDVQTGQPSNPQNNQQTGDNSNLPVWSMMLLVSGGMLFALLLGKKQKNAE